MKAPLLAIATTVLLLAPTAHSAIPLAEQEALRALHLSTNGGNWLPAPGNPWLGAPGTECSWGGVSCNDAQNTVTALDLTARGLAGPLPPEIGMLTNLRSLRLGENSLTGQLPPQLGSLKSLTVLDLQSNALDGLIPPELGTLTQLAALYLHKNQLSGSIPPLLGSLKALAYLYLSSNRLTGQIPPELGGATNLKGLILGTNQLSGSIPPELGQLVYLTSLYLSENELSGAIPPQFGALTRLEWLRAGSNHLSGAIPPELGNLLWLRFLDLHSNELIGPIPGEIGNLRHLQYLYLNSNRLTGEMPPSLAFLTAIYHDLNLSYNGLAASEPAVRAWADFNQPSWAATQTVPPNNVSLQTVGAGAVSINWTSIQYTGDAGRYEVFADSGAGGVLAGSTTNKTATGITLNGYGPTQSFRVRSVTDPHSANENQVISEFSASVGGQPSPLLSISDVTITEGDVGTRVVSFDVTLSVPSSSPVTVQYSTSDGLARGGFDYVTVPPTTLSFAPGERSRAAIVQVMGDYLDEKDESFYVDLSNATGATVADGHAVAFITDDDDSTISVNDVTLLEGNGGPHIASFRISLSKPSELEVTLHYRTIDQTGNGAATAGSDYTPIPVSTLSFLPGEIEKSVNVTILGDLTVEPDEWFMVFLYLSANAGIADSHGMMTILDDDATSVPDPTIDVIGCKRVGEQCSLAARSASGASTATWECAWSMDGVASGTGLTWTPTLSSPGTRGVTLTARNVAGSGSASTSLVLETAIPCPQGFLCALAGRFQIALMARDARTGGTGAGVPLQENDLFGFFSLPSFTGSESNPEVFVKILDGRPVNGNFWVFFGGLTDLGYDLTVVDTIGGTTKVYTKPAGTSRGGFDVGSGVTAEVCESGVLGRPAATLDTTPCTPNTEHLCIDASRFRVKLIARDHRTGQIGAGLAIPRGDVFGYFALPALTSDPKNPEVFVKVLDGREVNGHFWVFYGGLTDLAYILTVNDTVTGETKSYEKAPGSSCGAFDVSAF